MNKREILEIGGAVANVPLKELSKEAVMSLIKLRIEISEEWKRFEAKRNEVKNQCIHIEDETERNEAAETLINEYLDDKSTFNVEKLSEDDLIIIMQNGEMSVDRGAFIYQYLG